MNKDSNIYIFIYASAMVVFVAAILSFTAETLKPLQKENIKVEKIQSLLISVGIESTKENAQEVFDKYIPAENRVVINSKGESIEGVAFDINIKAENYKDLENRSLPMFIVNMDDGTKKTIIPLLGAGLWGPIWGYLAFEPDNNTIYGAVFDHKAETPGLGADINKDWFEHPFRGKTIFEGEEFVSITTHKGGKGAAELAGNTEHGVDAISGGTITSKALEKMIFDGLDGYQVYLKNNK